MAEIGRELNWSNYQDKQLRVLESLERSFTSSVRSSIKVEGNLSKLKSSMDDIVRATKDLASLLNGGTHRGTSSTSHTESQNSALNSASSSMNDLTRETESQILVYRRFEGVINYTAEQQKAAADKAAELAQAERDAAEAAAAAAEEQERSRREEAIRKEEEKRDAETRKYNTTKLLDLISYKVSSWGDTVDKLSQFSNNLISTSGGTLSEVQDVRRSIIQDIVPELNKQTGNYFNAEKVYDKMVSVATQSGIGDLDVLRDITRPIMIAQESMDINIGDLSSLLTRWSTRYNFSSMNMEDLVNDIRNTTKGNQATDEQILKNKETLKVWDERYANYDSGEILRREEELSNASAWIDSLLGDSARYTEYAAKIADQSYLQDTSLLAILQYAGLSPEAAHDLYASGGYIDLYQAFLDGETELAKAIGAGTIDEGLNAYAIAAKDGLSLDPTTLMDSYGIKEGENYISAEDFASQLGYNPAVDTIEDKNVTFLGKITNILSKLYEPIARVTERWGIGLNDLAGIYVLAKGAKSGLTTVLSALGLSIKGSSLGSSLGAVFGKLGPALGIAGSAVGLALIAKDIYDIVEEEYGKAGDPYQRALAGKDAPYGYGLKGTYNSSTGKVEWSYEAFKSKEEADSYDEAAVLDQYLTTTYEDLPWYRKVLDYATTGLVNQNSNTGIDSLWKEDQTQTYENALSILDSANPLMRKFYTERGLLSDFGEIQHFAKNLDSYTNAWSKELWYDKENQRFYHIADNTIVAPGEAPAAFSVGTNYVTEDQLAYIHEGEAIVPKRYNPMANLTELEALREQSKTNQARYSEDSRETQEYIRLSTETLSEIKQFLSVWKEDNIKRENAKEQREKHASSRQFVAQYLVNEY